MKNVWLSNVNSAPDKNLLIKTAPIIFVLLWSTGFVGAKYGTNGAEPFTFLFIRFFLTLIILLVVVCVFLRPKIDRKQFFHSIISGCLLHGGYLGGVFYAVDKGMPAGISSLVVALQPFFTAVIAWVLLKERLGSLQALFFLGAIAGVFLVLFPDLSVSAQLPGINTKTLIACLLGTLAISIGAVYQKKFVSSLSLWVSSLGQFIGATLFTGLLSFGFETQVIDWSLELIGALVWLILVLSIGAVALLMFLIRRDSTSSTASLFFLVPVSTSLMTWVLFGETMNGIQLAGSFLVVLSVGVAARLKPQVK